MLGHGGNGSENFYDAFDVGLDARDFYGVLSAGNTGSHDLYNSGECDACSMIFYSYFLEKCHYCI
ncbi:MAG: hypothetical protein H6767_04990 [Candidatus Peribacteria bacterium]|nr:MAG: hypothetical protein H6767_04990 [Candidatus Peribacteria bacterium]